MAVLTRHGTRLGSPARTPIVIALVFCLALAGLVLLRSTNGSSERPGATAAERAALDDQSVRYYLAQDGYDRVVTGPLDDRHTRVAFFHGPRIVVEVAVPPAGEIRSINHYEDGQARLGSAVGQRAPILAFLVLLFALATVRRPLRCIENVDVAVLASFAAPIVLLNWRYLESSVLAASVLMAYLGLRCASVALGHVRPAPARFLFERASRRLRRLTVAVAVLALLLLAIPGGLASDVAFASMLGATHVLEGGLPYGQPVPWGLLHLDTYPLLAYLAYVPGALLGPVRNGFDYPSGALFVATGFTLAAAAALAVAVRRAGGDGTRAALAMLAFPPVMIAASSGSNDAVAAALVAVALALGSTAMLTAAGWVKLAPLALVPLWIAAARRRGRALAGTVGVTAAVAAVLVALGGPSGYADFFHAVSFQLERGSLLSPWAVLDAGGAQVVFQAGVIAGIVAAALRVWRDRALAVDPRRMAALGAAILLAVQLAANYWSYTYLAWVFPLIAVALLSGERRLTAPKRSPPPAPSA